MVASSSLQENLLKELPTVEHDFKWSSIKLSEVFESKLRLDACVFDIDGKHARDVLHQCKWELVDLLSNKGLLKDANYPGRFKRIYVEKQNGIPFYLPSQINELYPKPSKYISPLTNTPLESLKVKLQSILLTRSGTIGDCTIVTRSLLGKIFSDDVIRLTTYREEDVGYIYAFLKTKIGQILLRTNNYGAVVQHIEPEHLSNVPIPNPDPLIKSNIHKFVMDSYRLRDESNELIDEAEQLLIETLKLPAIEKLNPQYSDKEDPTSFSVKASQLVGRFESTYHKPVVERIIEHITKHAREITTLGDPRISRQIILPGRFKRVYVEEGQGVIFFGGRELLTLDPSGEKFLSLIHHAKRIKEELSLLENMIMITCSGTIGKVNIVSKHWQNWTANQHIIRIVPNDASIAGYIYTWLNTDYGYELIKRFTYGAVVNEIDKFHVAQIQIPLLKNKEIQSEINQLVLNANAKRYEAYRAEQEAIKLVNHVVLYSTK